MALGIARSDSFTHSGHLTYHWGWITTGHLLSQNVKNIERHTAHTIVSWPNPKQGQMGHTSDLMMMMIRSITGVLTIMLIFQEWTSCHFTFPTWSCITSSCNEAVVFQSINQHIDDKTYITWYQHDEWMCHFFTAAVRFVQRKLWKSRK